MDEIVTVYGADSCSATERTQRQLRSLEVGYRYINVNLDPMGDLEARELNHGVASLPTVVIEGRGTRILFTPDEAELQQALVDTQLVDPKYLSA